MKYTIADELTMRAIAVRHGYEAANAKCATQLRILMEALCGAHSPKVRHDNPASILTSALISMDPEYDLTAAETDALQIATDVKAALDERENVTIESLARVHKTIQVEADDESEAGTKARQTGHRHGWIPWCPVGDSKPARNAEILVIGVTLLEDLLPENNS